MRVRHSAKVATLFAIMFAPAVDEVIKEPSPRTSAASPTTWLAGYRGSVWYCDQKALSWRIYWTRLAPWQAPPVWRRRAGIVACRDSAALVMQ